MNGNMKTKSGTKRILTYLYTDIFNRPVYQDAVGGLFVDTACGKKAWGAPSLHTMTKQGEPDSPICFEYTLVGEVTK